MHELGHGLGFLDSFKFDRTNNQGAWGEFDVIFSDLFNHTVKRLPYIYDRFVENGSGQDLIDRSYFAPQSTALGSQLTSNNIFFNGTKANVANGGRPVLYAPTTWTGGSSIAHLDEGTYNGTLSAMMTPALSSGEAIHELGPTAFGIFQDIGWKMNTEGWMYGTPGDDRLDGEVTAPLREQRIYGLEGQDFLLGGGGMILSMVALVMTPLTVETTMIYFSVGTATTIY